MKTQRALWSIVAVLVLLVAACGTAGPERSLVPGTGIAITAAAGPTCPVERVPPDPACAPRPVAGATILVLDEQGQTVATVVTGAEGTVLVALSAGDYILQPQLVEGFMGTADQVSVTVVDGSATPAVLAYDTGIR